MKRIVSLLALAALIQSAGYAYDIQKIDSFKAVFNQYPQHTPTSKTTDAPITGNGDIGLTMVPNNESLTFYVGKNDFWRAIESYPLGGLMLPGGLDLVCPDFQRGTYQAEQLPGSALLKGSFQTDDNRVDVCAWVAAQDNDVVIELTARKQTAINLRLWTKAGEGAIVDGGCQDGCTWVTRTFDSEDTKWPSNVAIAMNQENQELQLKPGETKTLVLSVYTNHDTPQWKQKAISEAGSITSAKLAEVKKRHTDWWTKYWNLSTVEINDEFIEKYYYQSQYLFACASREGKYAPGLWGPFITQDNTAWAGDYHLNYNYQSPYWACYSSNHIDLTDNYDQPILDYMDRGREHARKLCNCNGVLYPVGIGPDGLCSAHWPQDQEDMKGMYGDHPNTLDDGAQFWKQRTNASFCAVNMMMRFYSTYDRAYAQRIYPFVRACADFWEDYMQLENGRYVIHHDTFNEVNPWSDYQGEFNCLYSLGMARMTFLGVDNLSRFLNIDPEKRAKWEDILKRLSDFPVGKNSKGQMSLKHCERLETQKSADEMLAYGTNRIHMHSILFTGVEGPYLTPEVNSVMLSDLNNWVEDTISSKKRDWGSSFGNGVETVYPGAIRIGFPATKVMEYLKNRIRMYSYPNCYIVADGGGIETLSSVPSTVNEMLMQSYEGIIRIFPNWDNSRDASFKTLRAYGAFLVSSAMQNGQIQDVTIYSEQGRPCVVQNPWPGHNVRISSNGKAVKTLSGDKLNFNTKVGETLVLQPVK